jgi:Tfp pilus assembly protein PilN
MIIINLLPYHLRPIKRTPLPYFLSVGVLILAMAAAGYLFLSTHAAMAGAAKEKRQLEAEFQTPTNILNDQGERITLADIVEEYNKLSVEKAKLGDRIAIIKEILTDRIIWSEQLHKLAKLTPANIWYGRIRVTLQTFKEQRIKTDPKTGQPLIDATTKQPQTEMQNVKRPVLEITGYAISDEQGERQISQLLDNTTDQQRDAEFVKRFTLMRPNLSLAEINGFVVRKFILEYLIESGGA